MSLPNTYNDCVLSARVPLRTSSLPNINLSKSDSGKLVQGELVTFSPNPQINVILDLANLEVGNHFTVLLASSVTNVANLRPIIISVRYSQPEVVGPVTVTSSALIRTALSTGGINGFVVNNVDAVPTDGTTVPIQASSSALIGLKLEMFVADKTSSTLFLRMVLLEATTGTV